MIVLIANIGSTSFKYKLYDLPNGGRTGAERVLAHGAADRIGQAASDWSLTVTATGQTSKGQAPLADHAAAIDLHLKRLIEGGAITSISQLQAVGYKAVHGGPISGAVIVDEKVLAVMEEFSDVAPLHNPPYIAAMRAFARMAPNLPQVAAFETGYHQTIPRSRQVYAIPHEWTEKLGIRRYGFHGASHRYIATRIAELTPGASRIISCHLGGSSSVCAIQDGLSVANSFGMTVQTGVPHAARVGDFDAFAILKLIKSGLDLETIWKKLGKEGGMAGMSGVGQDMRDIQKAADDGNERAKLAIEVFVESVRHYVGAYLSVLGGADAICFTGGIGQYGKLIRASILKGMQYAGIVMDAGKNEAAPGNGESRISGADSRVAIWVMETNEELIVARQTVAALGG